MIQFQPYILKWEKEPDRETQFILIFKLVRETIFLSVKENKSITYMFNHIDLHIMCVDDISVLNIITLNGMMNYQEER